MSRFGFEDGDPGNKPVIFDPITGDPLPADHPAMRAIEKVWANTTLEERRAWFNVCCLNSRDPTDMKLALGLRQRFEDEAQTKN